MPVVNWCRAFATQHLEKPLGLNSKKFIETFSKIFASNAKNMGVRNIKKESFSMEFINHFISIPERAI